MWRSRPFLASLSARYRHASCACTADVSFATPIDSSSSNISFALRSIFFEDILESGFDKLLFERGFPEIGYCALFFGGGLLFSSPKVVPNPEYLC